MGKIFIIKGFDGSNSIEVEEQVLNLTLIVRLDHDLIESTALVVYESAI